MGHSDDTLTPDTLSSPFRRPAQRRADGLRVTDPVLVGRYRIVRRLGEGGMGVVYVARDPDLDRDVAIKVLHPRRGADDGARERLLREARSLARLSHPNVVEVYDVGRCGDGVYLAMELVVGETLAQWMARRPRWSEVVDVFVAAGLGLAAAHEAGIVHRDFKPANVIVREGKDVRVLDFGLARAAGASPGTAPLVAGRIEDVSLTNTGSIVGTPAYMAPEQIKADSLDARTDQFSFCVALYEALYGARPWSGDTWPQLAASIIAARVPTPPRRLVPARLLPIVRRGLAREPADRFPDMQALVFALRSVPRRRRAPVVIGLGITLAAAVAIAWPDAAEPCDPTPRMAAVWNDNARDAIADRFRASTADFAEDTERRVHARLDDFAQQWSTAYTELCTTVGDASELDVHMRCLGGRLESMAAIVGVLAELDATELRRADRVVDGLPDIAACRDVEAPADVATAAIAAELATLERDAARVDALVEAGRAPQALELAESTIAAAERLGLDAAVARAQSVYGNALRNLGRFTEARDAYQRAYLAAAANHDDHLSLALASMLVFVHGVSLGEHDEARRYIDEAEAMLERGTYGPRELGRFHNNVGAALAAAGDLAAARDRHQRALGLIEGAFGPEDLSVAHTFDMLASVTNQQGHSEEAEELQRRAIAIRSAKLGEHHPAVADSLNDLGSYLNQQRRYEEAEAAFRRSYAVLSAAYGEDNNRAMVPLSNAGQVLIHLGRIDEAKATLQRVLAVQERELGVDHHETVITVMALANLYAQQGDADEAEELLLRAVSSLERVNGPDHADVGLALNALAAIYATNGDDERGLETFERVLAIRERSLPPAHPWIAATHYNIAASLNNLERYDDALAHYEESLRIARLDPDVDLGSIAAHEVGLGSTLLDAGEGKRAIEVLRHALPTVEREAATDPWFERQLADGRFALARALVAEDPSSPEALALATSARDFYQRHPELPRHHLERIQTWLGTLTP